MSDLLKELEDDIRQERLQKLWNSLGKAMVAASAAIVLATIAVVVWKDRTQAHAMEQTSRFIKAADLIHMEDYKSAIALLDGLSQDTHSSYYALAGLKKAQAEAATGDKEAAAKTYQALARQSPNDALGQAAAIMAADLSGSDITPVKATPLYATQSEWQAWQLIARGKKDEAVALLLALRNDADAPQSLRTRVSETLRHLAPEKLSGPAHE